MKMIVKNFRIGLLIMSSLLCVTCFHEIRPSWFSNFFKDTAFDDKVDITQDDDNVIVTMHVPEDIDAHNITVEIKDKTLYVYGVREEKKEVRDEGYYQSHVSSSSFHRVETLPCLVDDSETTAEISKGVLTIVMPKIKEEEPIAKKVKVIRSKR